MFYINKEDGSIIYFSFQKGETIETKDPFSVSLEDFARFSNDEKIKFLKFKLEKSNNE